MKKKRPESPLPPEDFERVKAVLAFVFRGLHHLEHPIRQYGFYAETTTIQDLATYDGDMLTRLVVAAHDQAIRVSLRQAGPHHFTIMLHPRQRDGNFAQRHPTLMSAVANMTDRTIWEPPSVEACA